MIVWQNQEPGRVVYKGKNIVRICTMNKTVFMAFMSCFGAGYWRNDKPWMNSDTWKN